MNPARCALVVLSILVAAFAAAAPAGAKSTPPNLVVTKVSKPPKTKTLGSKIKLAVKVANRGGSPAGASKLGLYLAKGKKHTNKDKRLKRVKVKPIDPGKAKKLKLKLKALLPPKLGPGSYRLFACADDTRKLKEGKEGDNCRASKKLRLVRNATAVAHLPSLPPGRSGPPPAAAFSMSDGVDWGFVEGFDKNTPEAGDPVTVNLTAANGIAGQGGYDRSEVAAGGFLTGDTTSFDFSGTDNSEDDGQVTVQLPFAFPFGGIKEDKVSVSTNGWVSFRSPAWDYWNDVQPTDYRGGPAVVGELERGIMPFWADLTVEDEGAEPGIVQEVVAPDNSWVAFQWDLSPLVSGGLPLRTFQLVLFPDGSFRFDYPGDNETGGTKGFVGYSLGNGASSADVVAENTESVPSTSLLYKPRSLPVAGASEAGTVSTTLPKGSAFVSADSGCTLATAPTATSTGLVRCDVPSLALGQQTARNVTFAMPQKAPGETAPANFRYLGTYRAGTVKLTDGDEIDALSTDLEPTTIVITPQFDIGPPFTFKPIIKADSGGLDEPVATFTVTNASIASIEIEGQPIECTTPGGDSVTCQLPSGVRSTEVDVVVVPDGPGAVEFTATVEALNAPTRTESVGAIAL